MCSITQVSLFKTWELITFSFTNTNVFGLISMMDDVCLHTRSSASLHLSCAAPSSSRRCHQTDLRQSRRRRSVPIQPCPSGGCWAPSCCTLAAAQIHVDMIQYKIRPSTCRYRQLTWSKKNTVQGHVKCSIWHSHDLYYQTLEQPNIKMAFQTGGQTLAASK